MDTAKEVIKVIHDGETYIVEIIDHNEETIFIGDITMYKTGEVVTEHWFECGIIHGFKTEIDEEIPNNDSGTIKSLDENITSALQ